MVRKVDGGSRGKLKIYASGHMDKEAMTLVHTCGTMLPGEPQHRHFRKFSQGRILRRKYTLEQPQAF